MALYPDIEPFDQEMLTVGVGNCLYWEVVGNPEGKPAVVLHGGPGSGCGPGWRRYFDPAVYRVVLFDQRGCGRSTPNASTPAVGLSMNTTHHLVSDMELLRQHLGIERWLVLGGSWGTTLALAYAARHRERVSEMVLFSVTTTTRKEIEWLTRDAGRFFPEAWSRFRDAVPVEERAGDLSLAYARLLASADPKVREKAAKNWCAWEDSHVAVTSNYKPDPRYDDPAFRMTFARLVTHYFSHAAWLADGELLQATKGFAQVPGVLVHGRLDVSTPPDIAWELSQAWPGSRLVLIDDAGHGLGHATMSETIVEVIDGFRGG
jgi:proline iminopeptidase